MISNSSWKKTKEQQQKLPSFYRIKWKSFPSNGSEWWNVVGTFAVVIVERYPTTPDNNEMKTQQAYDVTSLPPFHPLENICAVLYKKT